MSKFITTVHYASIPVYSSTDTTMHQEYLRQKAVDIITTNLLKQHIDVEIDEEFRCVFLTEVGVRSTSLEALSLFVEELLKIVSSKKYLTVGGLI